MRFNPVISISLGVIVCFVLLFIAVLGFGENAWAGALFSVMPRSSWFGAFLLIISYWLGGFIATYFAKVKKIKYGLYEGLCVILLLSLFSEPVWSIIYINNSIGSTFFAYFMIFWLAITGGMLALMTETKYNGFTPVLSIIAGSVIGYSCIELLALITGYYPASYNLGVINIMVGVISLVIGGFVTTFLAKEKNILLGIYTGILINLIGILQTSITSTVVIHIGAIVIYILSAAVGSYLAIILAK